MIENRVWLIITKAEDGSAIITLTMNDPPEPCEGTAIIRARGMVIGDLTVAVPAQASEP